jgi:hypothetical protein
MFLEESPREANAAGLVLGACEEFGEVFKAHLRRGLGARLEARIEHLGMITRIFPYAPMR